MASSVGFFGDYRAQWVKHPIPSTVITVLAIASITLGALSYARIQPFHSLHSVNGSIAMWSAGAVLLLLPCIVASIKSQKELPPQPIDDKAAQATSTEQPGSQHNTIRSRLTRDEALVFSSQLKDDQYFYWEEDLSEYRAQALQDLADSQIVGTEQQIQKRMAELRENDIRVVGRENGEKFYRNAKAKDWRSERDSFFQCGIRGGKLVQIDGTN